MLVGGGCLGLGLWLLGWLSFGGGGWRPFEDASADEDFLGGFGGLGAFAEPFAGALGIEGDFGWVLVW
ncbi:MAG: hypothetical protein C4321_06145, partial [Chloroflexota bacterium]